MCFGCGLWYPLNELGYKVLGLDPGLPLWVNSVVDSDLFDIYVANRDELLRASMGRKVAKSVGSLTTRVIREWLHDTADKTRDAYHKSKLDETSSYQKILASYDMEKGPSDCYLFTLHYMIRVNREFTSELWQSSYLPEHGTLWKIPDREAFSVIREGRVSLPRAVVYEQYHNSPELAKFVDFID